MAEFSEEYICALGLTIIPDFSYLEEFSRLKENESRTRICEGFGSIGFKKKDSKCYLVYHTMQSELLETAIHNLIS